MAIAKTRVPDELQAQRDYVQRRLREQTPFRLVVADAFVRGMREIGYKSTATAIDELIDNGEQAGARNVHIIFGYREGSAKPAAIAVLDDGHGMDDKMIRFAVAWGGTHREDNRKGFGRFGYGLPSASLSQGRRFTVFSKVTGGYLHSVRIDVTELSEGQYTSEKGEIEIPEAVPAQLPDWIQAYMKKHKVELGHGTVVLLEEFDKLDWKQTDALQGHLMEHFGIAYRNYLRQMSIFVNGEAVQSTDPLFITPGYRYYEIPGDPDRAEAIDPIEFEVRDPETRKSLGVIKVRLSYLPPTFPRADKTRNDTRNMTPRNRIMEDHRGLIICRNGRQVDVVTRIAWKDMGQLQNYDRFWGCEIDFPATLDEDFKVTTTKQQIVLSERMWGLLREAGVHRALRALRGRVRREHKEERERREAHQEDEKRRSEQAVEKSQEIVRRPKPAPETQDEADKRQELEAGQRAKLTGRPKSDEEAALVAQLKSRPFKVEFVANEGATFYWPEQVGSQLRIYINTAHPFFTEVFMAPGSSPRLRDGLELLLFALGECEIDSTGTRKQFYVVERNAWSERLKVTLDQLRSIDSVEDEEDAEHASADEEEDAEAETNDAA